MELTVEYLRQRHAYWIERLADAGIWEADKFKRVELVVRERCKSYVGLFHRKWVKVNVRRRLRDRIIIYRKSADMTVKEIDKPISLGAVDTAIITRFAKWIDEQKARNGTDQPLSLDTRMVILRATRAVFNQAYKDGHTTMVANFKGLIHAGNRRRLNALTVEGHIMA